MRECVYARGIAHTCAHMHLNMIHQLSVIVECVTIFFIIVTGK